jgi:hypothetical protein
MIVAGSKGWEPGDALSRVLGQRRNTPGKKVERAMGIEPTAQAWEAWVLPLYDARAVGLIVVASLEGGKLAPRKGKAPCGAFQSQ